MRLAWIISGEEGNLPSSLSSNGEIVSMDDNTAPLEMPRKPAGNTRIKRKNSFTAIGFTLVMIAFAWVYGYSSLITKDPIELRVLEVIPGAARVDIEGDLFVGLAKDGEEIIGYAARGRSYGYGGTLEMLVGVDTQGQITGVKILKEYETPDYLRRVKSAGFLEQFINKKAGDSLRLGKDLDSVSGATMSAEGIAASVRQAMRTLEQTNQPSPEETRSIAFGLPEITLVFLYAAGYFGHKTQQSGWKRNLRWGTMITGMVVLGFIYTMPLTIAQIISLLSGFWPDWHNNLYWYFLLGGIIFVTTVDGKNPYCFWFCPFGSFQECLAKISGAKLYRPKRWSELLTWVQRGLALAAILLGLATRRPGVAGYEPFPTLFDLQGSPLQWAFLSGIILASLIIYRPFCSYLCPVRPVVDFMAEVRRQIKEVWRRWQKYAAKS